MSLLNPRRNELMTFHYLASSIVNTAFNHLEPFTKQESFIALNRLRYLAREFYKIVNYQVNLLNPIYKDLSEDYELKFVAVLLGRMMYETTLMPVPKEAALWGTPNKHQAKSILFINGPSQMQTYYVDINWKPHEMIVNIPISENSIEGETIPNFLKRNNAAYKHSLEYDFTPRAYGESTSFLEIQNTLDNGIMKYRIAHYLDEKYIAIC